MTDSASVILNSDLSNAQSFVDGLYNPRDDSVIQAAVAGGQMTATIADTFSRGIVLNSWLQAWQAAVGISAVDPITSTDQRFMQFLSQYIAETGLLFAVPQLSLDGSHSEGHEKKKHDVPVYSNAGYELLAFQDDGGNWSIGGFDGDGNVTGTEAPGRITVARFLTYLYYGAHIVIITSSNDSSAPAPDFQDNMTIFAENHGIPTSSDPGNSHYTNDTNRSGIYWLKISNDVVPADNPMVLAFMCGLTAHSDKNPNCFIQMEGWPANADLSRHKNDYAANERTFWNFSTFGASAYSEKRESPLFLCPPDFDLTLNSESKMPVYSGAAPTKHWMHPELMNIA